MATTALLLSLPVLATADLSRSRTSASAATSAAICASPQSLRVPVAAVETVRRREATSAQAAAMARRTRRYWFGGGGLGVC